MSGRFIGSCSSLPTLLDDDVSFDPLQLRVRGMDVLVPSQSVMESIRKRTRQRFALHYQDHENLRPFYANSRKVILSLSHRKHYPAHPVRSYMPLNQTHKSPCR